MLPPWSQRILDVLAEHPDKSAAGLARACNIGQGSVSGWFGKGKPTKMISGDNLVAAARYLGTTPEWIMTGRNPATGDNPAVPYNGPTTTATVKYSGGTTGISTITLQYFDLLSGNNHIRQGMSILNFSITAKNVACQ